MLVCVCGCFPSLRSVAITGLKCEVCPTNLLTHSWRENCWIYTLPKGLSMMGNVNNLVQDLNSDHRLHFPRL